MELYSESKNYKLYQGSMLDMLEVIDKESIDCIITDPPYELNFMGKGWDNAGVSFQSDTWRKCFDVLKDGGYLLAFGGSRTFHRIACAIEEAGFEIRDTIMWLYGCYSSDTEVLTNKGWKYFYELDKTEKVLQWNKDTNKLNWVKPLNYFEYDVEDEMIHYQNRHTDQLITQNHNVVVKIKQRRKETQRYDFYKANEIKKSWVLDFPLAGLMEGNIQNENAYLIGWWLTDAWKHKDGKAVMFSQSKERTLNKLKQYFDENNIKYSEYVKSPKIETHKEEHTFYVTGEIAKYLLDNFNDRELTWDMLNWDISSKTKLIEGLIDGDGTVRNDGYSKVFWSKKKERLDIFQALCISLNMRAYIDYEKGCVYFNEKHNSTQIQTKHHKPLKHYVGKVYCLETETGAFVVRRKGKAFISGNSGFPKSMNIAKSIEGKLINGSANTKDFKKLNGEQIDRGHWGYAKLQQEQGYRSKDYDTQAESPTYLGKLKPTTDLAKQWQGWGTCLKPSFEPIIIARKPFKGSLVDNVIKNGVGGLNIDECRIGTEERTYKGMSKHKPDGAGTFRDDNWVPKDIEVSVSGRFPANTILTYDETDFDEVCGGFPNTKSGVAVRHNSGGYTFGGSNKKPPMEDLGYNDSGSASRYFYCAKASKKDRDEGLDTFEEKPYAVSNQAQAELKRGNVEKVETRSQMNSVQMRKNIHPTVKPTELMQYLVRLVAPKGATILDPFMGSGSTGKAVMYENKERDKNYKFIGIELTEEYLPIAQARIDYAINKIEEKDIQMTIFDKV